MTNYVIKAKELGFSTSRVTAHGVMYASME